MKSEFNDLMKGIKPFDANKKIETQIKNVIKGWGKNVNWGTIEDFPEFTLVTDKVIFLRNFNTYYLTPVQVWLREAGWNLQGGNFLERWVIFSK